MIYNKSTHPVEVKKISLRVWSLRDEIEAAIGRRIKECEAAGVPLYIDDIKKFYNLDLASPLDSDNVIPLTPKADGMADVLEAVAADADAPPAEGESKTFNEAEKILEEQKAQGHDTTKPNPILERPYTRQAPDLDKISYGFTFLSDVNMDNILAFVKDKFLHGQSVTVEFLIPQSFMLTANVTYCHFYALRSRIISSTKPDYRLQCLFTFAMAGERDTLRKFLKSVEPTIHQTKKAKKKDEDGSLGV